MKPIGITLILVILVTPAICLGEWAKVTESEDGDTYYVDYERIRERGGHVYFWELSDYLKPFSSGTLSARAYNQGDCDLFRTKRLSISFYKEPMGEGTPTAHDNEPAKNWIYPPPDSVDEGILKRVCRYVKLSEEERQVLFRPSGFVDLVKGIEIREKNKIE